ncbi:cytochrome c oxidase assembly factor 1 homolog [Homalodisca vitripennis]|uniref:cytochrome c oxidase assembly factor 1 homolog n=1 Tax=Homalodisca vitripennis TaxID=197043 RepID=UPI001EEA0B50|nr:cytochrome c oxidase assembly factor 1 homolog [Homalodisca vitripennis]XP_046661289.1 cytochrome c oxidase assembly factor 1 homolog [Homalodisca vitripennis]XP_046661290.1 cytochrome c oxidase assembly factor 1 homolog [Homalodisca vitripennis]XP_046661291.1 cytochrome c oxidase assembly factor 1 homolog [Homalodisca vitripennis]XP_046661292.1 cytochrome c oxidase assembly factor 1 homolog [Homalodisca vitripennis]KAG8329995.1 hypothetical protein J6590_074000 [Homalodisca vitripennis]
MINLSLKTLVGIAGVGGMVTALTGYTLHGILQNRVRDSPVYKEAMKIINNHPAASQLLGKPVRSSNIDVSDKTNVLSALMSRLQLPIYGPKCKGILYIWADRLSIEEQWNIYRLELELLDELGGRLTILNTEPVMEGLNVS